MRYEKQHQHQLVSSDKPVPDTTAKNKAAKYGQRMDDNMNPDLAKSLDDFNSIYLPKHPILWRLVKSSDSAQQTKSTGKMNDISVSEPSAEQNANWKSFFDTIFTKPRMKHMPASVAAVRG